MIHLHSLLPRNSNVCTLHYVHPFGQDAVGKPVRLTLKELYSKYPAQTGFLACTLNQLGFNNQAERSRFLSISAEAIPPPPPDTEAEEEEEEEAEHEDGGGGGGDADEEDDEDADSVDQSDQMDQTVVQGRRPAPTTGEEESADEFQDAEGFVDDDDDSLFSVVYVHPRGISARTLRTLFFVMCLILLVLAVSLLIQSPAPAVPLLAALGPFGRRALKSLKIRLLCGSGRGGGGGSGSSGSGSSSSSSSSSTRRWRRRRRRRSRTRRRRHCRDRSL